MIIKNKLFELTLICVLFFTVLSGCDKDGDVILSGTWKVEVVHVDGKTIMFDDTEVYLNISKDIKEYGLVLSVNLCTGILNCHGDNGIGFETPGCTEMCCDSDEDKQFLDMIVSVSEYEISGVSMELSDGNRNYIRLMKMLEE
jgi:heat shock protein HslJ